MNSIPAITGWHWLKQGAGLFRKQPAALTTLVYYHAFLGLLGPDDVKGQRPTQEGTEVEVLGLNQASATIVDRFGVHDKPEAIDKLMSH